MGVCGCGLLRRSMTLRRSGLASGGIMGEIRVTVMVEQPCTTAAEESGYPGMRAANDAEATHAA